MFSGILEVFSFILGHDFFKIMILHIGSMGTNSNAHGVLLHNSFLLSSKMISICVAALFFLDFTSVVSE